MTPAPARTPAPASASGGRGLAGAGKYPKYSTVFYFGVAIGCMLAGASVVHAITKPDTTIPVLDITQVEGYEEADAEGEG